MQKYMPLLCFLATECLFAGYLAVSTSWLPVTVASHFNRAGFANGYMTKGMYLAVMLVIAIGIPSLIAGTMSAITRSSYQILNIPNRDFWLSDQYRERTISFLQTHSFFLGIGITLFLAYVHTLVINANNVTPAQLSNRAMIVGLIVFVIAVLLWAVLLPLKFMRIPKK